MKAFLKFDVNSIRINFRNAFSFFRLKSLDFLLKISKKLIIFVINSFNISVETGFIK